MPQRKSGLKELRKNRKRRLHNLDIKTDLKKTLKKFKAALDTNVEEAKSLLAIAYKKIDKATKTNIFHKNTAARKKAQLAKALNKKVAS